MPANFKPIVNYCAPDKAKTTLCTNGRYNKHVATLRINAHNSF